MNCTIQRCPASMVGAVIASAKRFDPRRYWGLSDTEPAPHPDSMWLGLGPHAVLDDKGMVVGVFACDLKQCERHKLGYRPVVTLSHVCKVADSSPHNLGKAVLDWLAKACPGAVVEIDAFEGVAKHWESLGFKRTYSVPFDTTQAPNYWIQAGLPDPAVVFLELVLPGSAFGEGSY